MKQINLFILISLLCVLKISAQNVFSVNGAKTTLNGEAFQTIGLRCSNALISDETTENLISHLDEYATYGVNTISVYFMGSRYSNVFGYNLNATLKL